MQFLAEQHLVAAKLVRNNGAARTGAERELSIRKSNSCVVCVSLMAKERGGICLDNFDWWSLTPEGMFDFLRDTLTMDLIRPGRAPTAYDGGAAFEACESHVRNTAAFGGKAEVARTSPNRRD
jgi:hypothetical protein